MSNPVTKETVLEALKAVQDPDLHRDIVALGFVKQVEIEGNKVSVTVELTTPACPVKEQMRSQAHQAIMDLPGVEEVHVEMTAQVRGMGGIPASQGLPGVRNIIPVASGKGGVGKSTVAVNLALSLSKTGAKVGLMDADVYGPSIPMMLGINEQPKQTENAILPVLQHDLRVISMGFFMNQDQAVIWRGPMIAKMVEQFIRGVEWGELDYLVVDLPPGTGDIQLTLCQMIPLTGAVVVSTPQDLALNVAQKAMFMFQQLNCPILGIVENMSYYVCPHCGEKDEIFGTGGAEEAARKMNQPFLGAIPLSKVIRATSDEGDPIVISDPESEHAQAFRKVAENMAAQISIRNMKGDLNPDIKVTF